mmetsp:Transcript_773/g.2244  ORF Transcript_773/g.2244 Transcript_773/m.2244 type:complete len:253 (-) Transcript_773:2456-3214(-)
MRHIIALMVQGQGNCARRVSTSATDGPPSIPPAAAALIRSKTGLATSQSFSSRNMATMSKRLVFTRPLRRQKACFGSSQRRTAVKTAVISSASRRLLKSLGSWRPSTVNNMVQSDGGSFRFRTNCFIKSAGDHFLIAVAAAAAAAALLSCFETAFFSAATSFFFLVASASSTRFLAAAASATNCASPSASACFSMSAATSPADSTIVLLASSSFMFFSLRVALRSPTVACTDATLLCTSLSAASASRRSFSS